MDANENKAPSTSVLIKVRNVLTIILVIVWVMFGYGFVNGAIALSQGITKFGFELKCHSMNPISRLGYQFFGGGFGKSVKNLENRWMI